MNAWFWTWCPIGEDPNIQGSPAIDPPRLYDTYSQALQAFIDAGVPRGNLFRCSRSKPPNPQRWQKIIAVRDPLLVPKGVTK